MDGLNVSWQDPSPLLKDPPGTLQSPVHLQ